MPSTSSVLSTYTTVAASAMVVRTIIAELQSLATQFIPTSIQERILGLLVGKIFLHSHEMTLIIDEYNGLSVNELYQACETYLSTRISPSVAELNISKAPRDKTISVTINKGQRLVVDFEEVKKLTWEFVSCETQKNINHANESQRTVGTGSSERRSLRLSFHRRYKERVLEAYIPSIVNELQLTKEEKKVVRLFSIVGIGEDYSSWPWSSVVLDHPSTFDTIAMDPDMKKELIDDLDQFVNINRREFYKRVGKAWKRGYLLYGPPGTGKSSLVAAMANYLKFDVYDMELTSLSCNDELKRFLVGTANRSILVIEDIDCSIDLENRKSENGYNQFDNKITLSGLLNFIDGLWSSVGDERIIVFTTNYKEKLDPALLRPGRMDKHIHMGYCCPNGFRVLAKNYLGIKCNHHLFPEIDELLGDVKATPAELAEELLKKNSDIDASLQGLIDFLKRKSKEVVVLDEDEKPKVINGETMEKNGGKLRVGPAPEATRNSWWKCKDS
ncbi:hypothetical protein ACFE04_025224 [Oxalis oulophora]